MEAKIIYVDEADNVIGAGTQQEAHDNGIIHRIVRIFLFNSKGELLLQKRGDHVRSNPGKWQESVAGHVDEGETYLTAAKRETEEEIGVGDVDLREVKKIYTAETEGKKRKRFNMLYRGTYDGPVQANPEEVAELRWISPAALRVEFAEHPERFTEGFRLCYLEL